MEKLRTTIAQIAFSSDERLPELPLLHRSLVPFLSLASHFYRLCLSLRRRLYFRCRRFPIPVISVGNLTWGGNGKTPMVEFIARYLDEVGIPPLILSRGYAGGDEAKMLQRLLLHTSVKVGIGVNRSDVAAEMFKRYGCLDLDSPLYSACLSSQCKLRALHSQMIGVVILDDGLQHWSLFRDVEVVMINGLSPWGNKHLIPRGSLREPIDALSRAHIGVIHHADLASRARLRDIVLTMQKTNPSLSIFFSKLVPKFLFDVNSPHSELPLTVTTNKAILCVSAIGYPDAFVQRIKEIGPLHVDSLSFSDHHSIKPNDMDLIRKRVALLQQNLGAKPIVLITEKDYDRDPAILRAADDFQILVLCSSLQIIPFEDQTEEDFRSKLKKLMLSKGSIGT